MTAVKRAWRGRGIAGALKATEINWALANGYTELHTSNEEQNAPINRLNARLGYRPGIGRIHLVGPIISGPLRSVDASPLKGGRRWWRNAGSRSGLHQPAHMRTKVAQLGPRDHTICTGDSRTPAPLRHGKRASGTPAAAVDLPCPVGSLDDVEGDRARSDCRTAAMAADLSPALGRDASHAAVPGEPGSGRDWCRLASQA